MLKLLPAILTITLSQVAWAERIYCNFTEPFISVVYNSDTNTVQIETPTEDPFEITAKVTFGKAGVITISTLDDSHKMTVNLNKEGSDGMSDFIYPFEGMIDDILLGGCETDALKKTDPTQESY